LKKMSLHRLRPFALLQLLLVLPGCAQSVPFMSAQPPQVAPGPIVGTQIAGNVAPVAAPVTNATVNVPGKAVLFGQPFAAAAVTAYVLGSTQALATTTTDANGLFALTLPAGQPADTIYKVTARGGGKTLVSLFRGNATPLKAHLLDTPSIDLTLVLTETSTVAFVSAASRFEASGQTQAGSQTGQVAFQGFQQLSNADSGLLTASSPASLIDAVLGATNDQGQSTAGASTLTELGAGASAGQQQAFADATGKMATALLATVSANGIHADTPLLGSLTFGNTTVAQVIPAGTGTTPGTPNTGNATPTGTTPTTPTVVTTTGSSGGADAGGGSGSSVGSAAAAPAAPPAPSTGAHLAITVQPGGFADPGASVSAAATRPPIIRL
jgi:hypothetical protein